MDRWKDGWKACVGGSWMGIMCDGWASEGDEKTQDTPTSASATYLGTTQYIEVCMAPSFALEPPPTNLDSKYILFMAAMK